jgi:hypothetical protein
LGELTKNEVRGRELERHEAFYTSVVVHQDCLGYFQGVAVGVTGTIEQVKEELCYIQVNRYRASLGSRINKNHKNKQI